MDQSPQVSLFILLKTYRLNQFFANIYRSDIWRLQLLMEYGGIYLDGDVYVVNSLDKYRRYETVVSWDQPFKTRGLGKKLFKYLY